jgi:hypothetical protein
VRFEDAFLEEKKTMLYFIIVAKNIYSKYFGGSLNAWGNLIALINVDIKKKHVNLSTQCQFKMVM